MAPPAILIVDDLPGNLLALEAVLEPLGARVVRAGSGEEALRRMLEEEFALIILDVHMPALDGFQTLSLIREREKTRYIPAIFLTAVYSSAQDARRGYNLGALDYITKPFDPDMLRAKARALLSSYHRAQVAERARQADMRHMKELLTAEERFRLLVDSVVDYAIFMLDPNGHVATWNRGAHRIKGYTADEIVGQHFSRFFRPEDIAAGHPERMLAEATKRGSYEEEGWRVRKDGTPFWANVVVTALRDPKDNSLYGFAKVTRDLSERKRAEEERSQLSEARERSDQANRFKTSFLSLVTHELRTPLAAIALHLERMRQQPDDPVEKRKTSVERMLLATERLSRLIDSLLEYARIDAGYMRTSPERFALDLLATETVDELRPQAELKRLRLRFSCKGEVPPLFSDRNLVHLVLVNLIGNAIKYAREGTIEVVVRLADGVHRLEVHDTGPGIPAQYLDRVFEPFEQLETANGRKPSGVGLGLALVKQIVSTLGGRIDVRSEVGIGTTFMVAIPPLGGSLEPDAPQERMSSVDSRG